jgi:hypothetical protein
LYQNCNPNSHNNVTEADTLHLNKENLDYVWTSDAWPIVALLRRTR